MTMSSVNAVNQTVIFDSHLGVIESVKNVVTSTFEAIIASKPAKLAGRFVQSKEGLITIAVLTIATLVICWTAFRNFGKSIDGASGNGIGNPDDDGSDASSVSSESTSDSDLEKPRQGSDGDGSDTSSVSSKSTSDSDLEKPRQDSDDEGSIKTSSEADSETDRTPDLESFKNAGERVFSLESLLSTSLNVAKEGMESAREKVESWLSPI